MKKIVVTRRQVLRGVGGYTLGLPFLPSLLPGTALGADPVFASSKRFVSLSTQHGALGPDSLYPSAATLVSSQAFKPGHNIKYGTLKATIDGDHNQLSPILRAPRAVFTDRLIGKMNVLRGFDIPFYIGHHTGGHLGNFTATDLPAVAAKITPFATIDQVMAWSPRFYSDLSTIKMRSIVTGEDWKGDSWSWSDPQNKTGTIQKVAVDRSSLSLFNKLFVPAVGTMPAMPPAKRKPIVDLVIANYRSLMQSDRRISSADKQRLADHISRLSEVQRRLNVSGQAPATCGSYTKPTTDSASAPLSYPNDGPMPGTTAYQLLNDVIAMAFACGTSRIATVHVGKNFSTYSGNWHQDVAHQWKDPTAQALLVAAGQATFAGAIVDLAAKLDAIVEDNLRGTTVLDNTHYQWTQESGWATHATMDMPIVVFGGAAGYFKTGQYVDFRNLSTPVAPAEAGTSLVTYGGIWVRQWLAAVLQAMDIPPSEFESTGKTGYGDAYTESFWTRRYHPDILNNASDRLPVITVGV